MITFKINSGTQEDSNREIVETLHIDTRPPEQFGRGAKVIIFELSDGSRVFLDLEDGMRRQLLTALRTV